MTRILYGVISLGKGHLIRSKVVIDYLKKKKHEVLILTSGEGYKYFKKYYDEVYNIEGFEISFKKNSVLNFKTFMTNLKKASKRTYNQLLNVKDKIGKFKPQLVITDMESFTSFIANENKIPLMHIDNQHFIVYGRYNYADKYRFTRFKALIIVKGIIFQGKHKLVMCLPGQEIINKLNVFKIKPIVRPEIMNSKPKSEDYVFVYQSTKSYDKLIDILKRINYKFIIYGFDVNKKVGNLIFKKFNDNKEFLSDLVNCKAVITNGGFTLISEAIYLEKPLLVVPIKKHFEQILNALYVQDNKYGEFYTDLNENHVVDFIMNLKRYKYKVDKWDNEQTFALIDMLIKKEKL